MYRENIYDVINATGEKISTLVIPKNTGLKGYAWQVLKEAGLKLDDAKEIGKNQLKLGDLNIILKRGEDIPQLVMAYAGNGEVILGVTGDDLYDEFRLRSPQNTLQIENTYDWFDEKARYKKPALCFINGTGSVEDMPLEARIALNSKYVYTSREYLRKSPITQGINFQETTYTGDVEFTVAEGTNDCCIDAVYSGKTLDDNGLKIVDEIRFSDLVVISPLKKDESFFGRVMAKEYEQILARKKSPTNSYTSRLLADSEKGTRKLNEEVYEFINAFYGRGDFIGEGADVMYAINLVIVSAGYSLEDIAKEMTKRQK